ncbi:MAG: 3-oxoacyl-[acyl-carrier protein] reductase, partial [uncultured Solirubrobacteraceae bacterium]
EHAERGGRGRRAARGGTPPAGQGRRHHGSQQRHRPRHHGVVRARGGEGRRDRPHRVQAAGGARRGEGLGRRRHHRARRPGGHLLPGAHRPGGAGRLRPDRRPREQRRRGLAVRDRPSRHDGRHPRDVAGQLARHHRRRRPRGLLPHDPRGAAAHARAGQRLHHQRLEHGRRHRPLRRPRLHGGQGRDREPHAVHGDHVRQAGRADEHRVPGLRGHPDDRPGGRRVRRPHRRDRPLPPRPPGARGGDRRPARVLPVGRLDLLQRVHPARGRGLHRPVLPGL